MIKATGLHHSYDGREILRGVDIEASKGEFLSIMGKSGSGKSTLLNVLAGNLRPNEGCVMLDGQNVTAMRERELAKLRRTKLGFVYQSLNLIPTLSARDNILLPLYLDRADLRRGKEKMQETAELLGVAHLLSSFPEKLSGGERQRVAIARAMIHDPAVLMLDEPTGSLDSRSTEDVMELLCKLNRECGVTVIQVTHSEHAAAYGTRVIRIKDGQVVT